MLSAKRMTEIFRRRGGSDYADVRQRLTADQIAYLQNVAGEEPVIAMMSSREEWFVITKSYFAAHCTTKNRRVPLSEILSVAISNRYRPDIRKFDQIKIDGGEMDVRLQDSTEFTVTVKPGGPYLGLMNVLMRVARTNRSRPDIEHEPDKMSPTTNDRRPMPQS